MPNDRRPILVVDDDPKVVKLVRAYLERDGFRVISAADGVEARTAIRAERPRLAILDLRRPGLDGRAVIRAIRDEGAVPTILVLSARGALSVRLGELEDGADDYLPKPFSPAELMLRVKSILRRTDGDADMDARDATGADRSRAGEELVQADLRMDLARYEVRQSDVPVELTRLEFRLLQVLLEANGRVLTRDQLMDAVYGRDAADVMDRTIDVHVGRLREKLSDDPDEPRYIATVRGVGYRAAPAAGR